MYRCSLALSAETILRDADQNRLTIVNLNEDLVSAGFPLVIAKLSTLFILLRDGKDSPRPAARIRLELDGELLFEAPATVDFGATRRHRAIMVLNGVVIPRAGDLAFILQLEGVKEAYVASFDIQGPNAELSPPRIVAESTAYAVRPPKAKR